MIKMVCLDNQDWVSVQGLVRTFEPPQKYPGNPITVSEHWSDGDRMSFYGSVLRRPDTGLLQMWYIAQPQRAWIAYAESQDGIHWDKPELDIAQIGDRWTNLIFTGHPWGPTIIFDEQETLPERRYKMVVGSLPSDQIGVHYSPDGIHWSPDAQNPVIAKTPGSPMSLHRKESGEYVLYHRSAGGRRRAGRSESTDLLHWSPVQPVLDTDSNDPPGVQVYALGAAPYGPFEIGSLWIFKTFHDDLGLEKSHGRIETELAYGRSGHTWHRAAQGVPFIPTGEEDDSWEWGCIQPASSPVYLPDEIRFYYTATRHENALNKLWKGDKPRCGVGFVSLKPDRFVCLASQPEGGHLLTRAFHVHTPQFAVNAAVAPGGRIRVAVTGLDGQEIEGFRLDDCTPITGDATDQSVSWLGTPDTAALAGHPVRLRVEVHDARLYALACGTPEERAAYWQFSGPV